MPDRRWRSSVLVPATAVALLIGSCSAPRTPAPRQPRVTVEPTPRPAKPAPRPVVAPAEPVAPPAPPSVVSEEAEPARGADREISIPRMIRVGLATDLPELRFDPGSRKAWWSASPGAPYAVVGPVRVRPAPGAALAARYRLQVAALKDEGQAEELARQLEERLGQPADAVFDAATDLYRVRVGAARAREPLDGLRRRLSELGFEDNWVVHEDLGLARSGLLVETGDGVRRLTVRAVSLATADGLVRFGGKTYRGSLTVFLNGRGALNVINRVAFEDYLRAVVPKELGPELYPELEALKAQAIAARTYVLRHFGEFAAEGYDVCATPRCQVYGGVAAEHPLSDRALRETRGVVLLYDGELVDALYSSTCGGHTERVETVFPEKRARYLRGVRCLEAGLTRLAAPRSGRGSLEQLLRSLPAESAPRASRELFLELRGEELLTHHAGLRRGRLLSDDVATFQRTSSGATVRASLELAAGDPLRLLLDQGRLVAVVQELPFSSRRVSSPHQDWTRFRSREEVRARVGELYPGFHLADLEVLRRGVSGRVADLELVGVDGRREIVSGLAVRWTLDVPDTWFEVLPARRHGEPGWRFEGHGWGHGVGMCQIGAFGMAARGVRHEEILEHYYSGVVLARLKSGPPASGTVSSEAGSGRR